MENGHWNIVSVSFLQEKACNMGLHGGQTMRNRGTDCQGQGGHEIRGNATTSLSSDR